MEKSTRNQLAFISLCLVAGMVIVAWYLSQTMRTDRTIVIDPDARNHPATAPVVATRPVTTRPMQKEFFAAMQKNDRKKATTMLLADPKLALVEVPADGYRTALHWAAVYGDIDMAEQLLADGAGLNIVETHHDGTPLEWAAFGGQIAMVQYLLERGATVDEHDINVATEGVRGLLPGRVKKAEYEKILAMLNAPPPATRPIATRPATTQAQGEQSNSQSHLSATASVVPN